jgi:hypothetical protein
MTRIHFLAGAGIFFSLSLHKDQFWDPSITKVKKVWSYAFTSPYIFMAWYLVKYRDNFIFTLELSTNFISSRDKLFARAMYVQYAWNTDFNYI